MGCASASVASFGSTRRGRGAPPLCSAKLGWHSAEPHSARNHDHDRDEHDRGARFPAYPPTNAIQSSANKDHVRALLFAPNLSLPFYVCFLRAWHAHGSRAPKTTSPRRLLALAAISRSGHSRAHAAIQPHDRTLLKKKIVKS